MEESILINKIPDGYKQTEVGVIPGDWEIKRLHEISRFENGKAHEQSIDERGDFVVINSKFISSEGEVRKYSKQNILPLSLGDITLVMSDVPNGKALAKCFHVDSNNTYTLNQRIGKIRAINEVDNRFLFYKLNRNKYYLAFDSGSGQTNLKRQEVLDCPIPLPPTLTEQTAIATALSDMDALIEAQEALLAKKRAIKQGAMQELLTGKRRLVETDGTSWQQTEVGRVPGDWEVKTLDALARLIIDGTHHTPVYKERGIPFLRVTDIRRRTIDYSNLKFISEEEHQNLIKRCHPERGDLLLSKNGTIGIPKVVKWDWPFSVFVSLCLIKLKPSKLDVHLLEQFFQSEIFNLQLKQLSKQGTVTNLHLEDIRKLKFPLPPTRHEQTAIANALSDMDAEIEQLEAQLAKYRQLKQGMMQELLTGRKRLI